MPVTLNIVSSHLNQSLVKPGPYRGHPPAGGQLGSGGGETGQEGRTGEEVAHESHIYDPWQEGRSLVLLKVSLRIFAHVVLKFNNLW